MGTGRMEAFSDGVIAIIITIMVLELKVPHGTDLAALGDLLPELANYVLSFVTSPSTGTTITICCTRATASTARSCGPTCTSCSGSRSSPS